MGNVPSGSTLIDVIPAETVPGHVVRLAFGSFLVVLQPGQAAELGALLLQAAGVASERTGTAPTVVAPSKLIF